MTKSGSFGKRTHGINFDIDLVAYADVDFGAFDAHKRLIQALAACVQERFPSEVKEIKYVLLYR